MNVSTGIGTASIGDKVDSDGIAIGYRDGDVRRSVKLRILNSIVDFEGSGILQQKGSEYNIKTLGIKKTDRRYSEWLENIATKHVVQDFKVISAGNFELILTAKHYYKRGQNIIILDADGQSQNGTITGILNDQVIYVSAPSILAGKQYLSLIHI